MSQVRTYPKQENQGIQSLRVELIPKQTKAIKKMVVTGIALSASSVFAAEGGVDVSTVIQTITGAVATVSAIGLAVLSLFVTAKVFKWVKTAM